MSSEMFVSSVWRRRSIAVTLFDVIISDPFTSRKDSTSSHFVGCFFAHLRERLSLLFAFFTVDGLKMSPFGFSSNIVVLLCRRRLLPSPCGQQLSSFP